MLKSQEREIEIGVGLRHPHYADVLAGSAAIDFVEVHAENFFAEGGASRAFLREVAESYPVSIHATTLGLGSARGVPTEQVNRLKDLIEYVPPFLLSDHACYAWSSVGDTPAHAGDLLPIPYTETGLRVLVDNLRRVQDQLGRELMLENLSAYVTAGEPRMPESEFLVRVCEQTDSRLLLDLNNIAVNAINNDTPDIMQAITDYISVIPTDMVGEIHLAGSTPVEAGEMLVDDHGEPVPMAVWEAYRLTLRRFGAVPSTIEWDTNIPSWRRLIAEVEKARVIAREELGSEDSGLERGVGQGQAG